MQNSRLLRHALTETKAATKAPIKALGVATYYKGQWEQDHGCPPIRCSVGSMDISWRNVWHGE